MTTRQVLYGSAWTPFNGSDNANPRPFSYWADLGFSDMLMNTGLPGTNGGPPAAWAPFGGANNADYKFVVNQAKAAGMNLILATKMHGNYAGATPAHAAPFNPAPGGAIKDWLTDTAFQATLLTGAHTLARWAKENGYIGIFTDEEISSSNDGWTYAGYKAAFPASNLTQAQAEQAAYQWGKQWGGALVAEFPGLEIHNYSASSWPSAWSNLWRTNFTNNPIYTPSLQNWFYKGVLSVVGYAHAYFWNADFYGGQYFPATPTPFPFNGKLYDRWQWGTVQFDRDQFHRFCFGPNNVAGGGWLDATTDPAKVDIVPFVAIAPIEPGSTNPNYATKPLSTVAEQIAPSIKQNINPGQRPVPLFGHYAYSNEADATLGKTAAGAPIVNPNVFDFSPYRAALRDAVGIISSSPITVTVKVTDAAGHVTSQPVTIQTRSTP